MDETKIRAIKGLVFLSVLWLLPTAGRAAIITVDCPSVSLQATVEKAKPGDTLLVSGTCNESVEITAELTRITLDGQGKATINGPDKNKPAIAVLGREITIKGFTVRGGRQGISIVWGGTAVVDGNTLENTGRTGITVSQNSSARITNNTIRNNPNQGILVAGSSFAWIGFTDNVEDTSPKPNTIQNNAVGIEVDRASTARIHGNTITGNKRYGVGVERGSQADIGGNVINGNGGDGIFVVGNSSANLGTDTGSDFRRIPNTSAVPNSGFGIRCSINSSADGRLGASTALKGQRTSPKVAASIA